METEAKKVEAEEAVRELTLAIEVERGDVREFEKCQGERARSRWDMIAVREKSIL